MAKRKRIPWTARRMRSAFFWLLGVLALFALIGIFFYQFVVLYDFEGITPGTEPVRDFLPEDGYIRHSYPPYDPNATTEPTPKPTPIPTAIPIEKYALLNKRMAIPESSYEKVLCGLTECRISKSDDNKALAIRGFGYIEGMDASKSSVYVVVSTKYGENHRIYLATSASGSSGVLHDSSTGTNLDQADFTANIRIEATFAAGEYRLGILVANNEDYGDSISYARLPSSYNFVVGGNQIIGFSKDIK